MKLKGSLAALKSTDTIVAEKSSLLDRILQHCLGLSVETTVASAEAVPGEPLKLRSTAIVTSATPVRWIGTRHLAVKEEFNSAAAMNLVSNQPASRDETVTLPASTPLTQPYWLRQEGTAGMFRVDDPRLIGQPENPPAFPLEQIFEVGGQTLAIPDEPLATEAAGKPARHLAVISPVSLDFGSVVALFTPGAKKTIEVEVTAARAGATGTLRLETPAGWAVTPAGQPFKIAQAGEKTKLAFTVTAPASPASGNLLAVAGMADGTSYGNQHDEIHYDHIPVLVLQPPARLKVVAFDFAVRGKNVGYLPGAGDDTVSSLRQLGYVVTTLTGADLTPEKLRGLDAVVIGVRAFNERTDLATNFPALLAWVEQGGTVIAQYNRPNGLRTQQLGPYPLSIQGQAPPLRVTDENAPVTFLLPDHPALNVPNKITTADFAGWVQERGAYFASQLGRAKLCRAARDERSRREAARQQPAHREGRQRLLRLYEPLVFPPAPRRRARRLPAVCQSGFARKMKVSEDNAEPPESPSGGRDETTGLPGLRTWRDVYLFVFACFVLSVLLLLVLTMSYS